MIINKNFICFVYYLNALRKHFHQTKQICESRKLTEKNIIP